ncbi:hypothetical protein EJB05_48227 [Eragrostis curvula]|uniref:FAR1 domain-containing protein n=1 Tax=Eragrostis curvula TaxID=38414 RepID=A0A5J9T142_9POAL|nr:hypothetical protein EJB05_48227 [Eragrostis curvula]
MENPVNLDQDGSLSMENPVNLDHEASQTSAIQQETHVIPSWVPQIGMKFSDLSEAWEFWKYYGGRIGFNVRKRYSNPSKFDGKITSCRYVCSKEGLRAADDREHLT